jgi:acyl-CoA thioester hydrolase
MDFPEHINIDNHIIKIVPRYSETDQGRVVHHSVYPVYFEMGRTELLRVNKVAYKDLEAAGVFFVVAELKIRYRKPARYDEHLLLETRCIEVKETRIEHGYKLTRESDGAVIAEGSSVLACVGPDGKLRRIPDFMFFENKKQTV